MAAANDVVQFRNGTPARMRQWLYVRHRPLGRRYHRFARLNGEVLSLYAKEDEQLDDRFDLIGAGVEYSDGPNTRQSRTLRIVTTRRTYYLTFSSVEEAQIWGRSLHFASQHRFEDCYQLGDRINNGTFSDIFLCTAHDSDQVFVVKRTRKRRNDKQALQWIERERHINSVLNDVSIVQAVDMFSTVERDYMVFEYMKGGTLEDLLLRKKRLPESYARAVMRQVFKSLCYIHANNVVHRDVQPSNIFCSDTRFPMSIALGDFGLANFISEKRVNPEVLSTMVGIPPYMSIDVVRRSKYGPAADMWSAGVVMYEVLSGELPFTGHTNSEIMEKIRDGRISFSQPVWDNVSKEAISLVKQLLQIDPYKRISALGALNHRWTGTGTPTSSRPPSSSTSIPSSPPPPPSTGMDFDNGVNGAYSRNFSQAASNHLRPYPMLPSLSSMSRVPSSTSSYMSRGDGNSYSANHLPHTQSQQQPRLQMTPSVRAIQQVGLQRVTSHQPSRMKRLLSSRVVQAQLAVALPYRRWFVKVARAFVAVSRLKALAKGHSATKHLAKQEDGDENLAREMVEQRRKELEKEQERKPGNWGKAKDKDKDKDKGKGKDKGKK